MTAGQAVDASPLFKGRMNGGQLMDHFGIDPAEWTKVFRNVEETAAASVQRDLAIIQEHGANPAAIVKLHIFAAAFALGVEFGRLDGD